MSPADLIFPLGVGLAEGGWVAVLYLLVDAVARVPAPLGPLVFIATAAVACLAAGRLDRLGLPRILLIVGLLLGGAMVGLLATGPARDPLARGALADAFAVDPGGALLGLAALRGFVRAGAMGEPGQAGRPFAFGIVGLTAAWVFAGALADPMRSSFREAALLPTVAFVFGSLITAGIARTRLAAGERVDPLGNRAWLAALLGGTAILAISAIPLGVGVERMFGWVIAWPLTVPVVVVALVAARLVVPSRGQVLRRAGAYTVGPLLILVGLAIIALVLPHGAQRSAADEAAGAGGASIEPTTPVFDYLFAGLVIVAIVAGLLLLARAWRRADGDGARRLVGDRRERVTDLDGGTPSAGGLRERWRRLRTRGRPTDAVSAYLATLRALEGSDDLRRTVDETPAAHARRLRRSVGHLELDLLAADFALARWGRRRISPSEDRRAIGRWGRLRDRLADRSRAGTVG